MAIGGGRPALQCKWDEGMSWYACKWGERSKSLCMLGRCEATVGLGDGTREVEGCRHGAVSSEAIQGSQ